MKPKPVSATSIPGLLVSLQNEWDSMMLETFTLKKHLQAVRQELSQALYQHEAACRVIARLIKERDQAREALAKYFSGLSLTFQRAIRSCLSACRWQDGGGGRRVRWVPAQETKISEEMVSKMTRRAKENFKTRPKRQIPEDLASTEDLARWSLRSTYSAHKTAHPRVNALRISAVSDDLILSGGEDHQVLLYNVAAQKIEQNFAGHSKPISGLLLLENASSRVVVSASLDRTVRIWQGGRRGEVG